MITDRTRADVNRWRELHDKGWAAMTAAERTEWRGEMKGRYAYTDMNRVETAVQELSEKLYKEGCLAAPLTVKTDWDLWDVPTLADMTRYLGNITAIRNAVTVYPTTPKAPSVNQGFDFNVANDIEKIIEDVNFVLEAWAASRYYSGELYAGEV